MVDAGAADVDWVDGNRPNTALPRAGLFTLHRVQALTAILSNVAPSIVYRIANDT